MKIQVMPIDPVTAKPVQKEGLGFGKVLTNRMFTQRYSPERGWHDMRIEPYAPLSLDPASAVFHYAQEIFEGTKAYRRPDGHINLFRIHDNVRRFNRSAVRMDMPTVEEEDHLDGIVSLIGLEHEWVPSTPDASLYIRPTLIATDPDLGALTSNTYLHFIVLSPVAPFFAAGFKPVAVYIEDEYVRAVRGGVGDAKTGGNYAASLYVTKKAKQAGFAQVLWLDALERRYVEEMGGMNICFVYGDTIVTPALTGTILPGITRDSVIRLGRDLGYQVEEGIIEVNQMLADIKAGKVTEVFVCGTAAVIGPVGKFEYKGETYIINDNQVGSVTKHIYNELTDIQFGRIPDRFGWTLKIEAGG